MDSSADEMDQSIVTDGYLMHEEQEIFSQILVTKEDKDHLKNKMCRTPNEILSSKFIDGLDTPKIIQQKILPLPTKDISD